MQHKKSPTTCCKVLSGTVGALIGAVAGLLAGAYLGMVVGGTFFGSVEFFGLAGYELGIAIGASAGVPLGASLGVVLAIRRLHSAGRPHEHH